MQIADAGPRQRLVIAVVETDAKTIGVAVRVALADLVSDRGAADRPGDGCYRIS